MRVLTLLICMIPYGDGWNGASVDVTVNGIIVVSAATGIVGAQNNVPAPCGSEIFLASTGDAITLSNWVSGSYDIEISWDIKDDNGTIIASGGTMAGGGGYGMLANCNGSCSGVPSSWDCNANGTCSDPGNGSGQFSSQSGCLSQCLSTPSWDCNANGTCSDPGDGSGQYSTLATCVNSCIVIPSWDCDVANGTCVDPGNGSGQYANLNTCLSVCVITNWGCDHTFNMYDSYGDGWNGATWTATGSNTGTVFMELLFRCHPSDHQVLMLQKTFKHLEVILFTLIIGLLVLQHLQLMKYLGILEMVMEL